jgi:hypothetical protein
MSAIEANDFVRRLHPLGDETVEAFSSRIELMESDIVGRARSQYGI